MFTMSTTPRNNQHFWGKLVLSLLGSKAPQPSSQDEVTKNSSVARRPTQLSCTATLRCKMKSYLTGKLSYNCTTCNALFYINLSYYCLIWLVWGSALPILLSCCLIIFVCVWCVCGGGLLAFQMPFHRFTISISWRNWIVLVELRWLRSN